MQYEVDEGGLMPFAERLQKDWCCYTIHMIRPDTNKFEMIYVGTSRFIDFPQLIDARKNHKFLELVAQRDSYSVRIETFGPRNECQMDMQRIFIDKKPLCNMNGGQTRFALMDIWCSINGGTIYHTQEDAARALGVHQSRVSKVLGKKPGHNTIKGCTLFYVPRAAVAAPAPIVPPPVTMPTDANWMDRTPGE